MILSGVFFLAPLTTQDWGTQAVLKVAAMRISADSALSYRLWGAEALDQIQSSFALQGSNAYAEQVSKGAAAMAPAFLWSRSVNLSALAAAAQVAPDTYLPGVMSDANSLRAYWVQANGLGGFDVLPGPKPVDRYYDDNAWMTLALLDTYEVTHDSQYLSWAEDTFRFVESGEDTQLGGGIYWREQDKESKNTCSTAPATLAALRLYQLTLQPAYLEIGQRLYAWINSHLQDSDHLFFDHIALDGQIDRTKWSYNSALMIQVNTLLYSLTGQPGYLEQAKEIGQSAQAYWVDPSSGAIMDQAPFAQHLAAAFLSLYHETGEANWLQLVERAVTFLHSKGVDPAGHYSQSWGDAQSQPLDQFRLIDSASAARVYWLLAQYQ